MTDLTRHETETPRDHLIRVRKAVLADARSRPEGDEHRAYLMGLVRAAEASVAAVMTAEAANLIAAITPVDSFDQTGDALDKVIPADAEGRAAVLAMTEQLLATAPPAPAPRAPAPRMRPNVPAVRRTENAGNGNDQVAATHGGVQPAAPAPRAPLARGPGARAAGGAPAAAARQPASTPTAGRPGPTGSSLGSLKRTSAPAERAEGPVDGAPAQPKRPGLKIHADGSVETERHMHLASGKIINKTTTKPKFVIPPMEPGDELIPW